MHIPYPVQDGPSCKIVELSSLWTSLNSSGQHPQTTTPSLLLKSTVNKRQSAIFLTTKFTRTPFWSQQFGYVTIASQARPNQPQCGLLSASQHWEGRIW